MEPMAIWHLKLSLRSWRFSSRGWRCKSLLALSMRSSTLGVANWEGDEGVGAEGLAETDDDKVFTGIVAEGATDLSETIGFADCSGLSCGWGFFESQETELATDGEDCCRGPSGGVSIRPRK